MTQRYRSFSASAAYLELKCNSRFIVINGKRSWNCVCECMQVTALMNVFVICGLMSKVMVTVFIGSMFLVLSNNTRWLQTSLCSNVNGIVIRTTQFCWQYRVILAVLHKAFGSLSTPILLSQEFIMSHNQPSRVIVYSSREIKRLVQNISCWKAAMRVRKDWKKLISPLEYNQERNFLTSTGNAVGCLLSEIPKFPHLAAGSSLFWVNNQASSSLFRSYVHISLRNTCNKWLSLFCVLSQDFTFFFKISFISIIKFSLG